MHTYQVHVTRDDRWWMIDVPELDGYVGADGAINLGSTTQARRLSDVPREAVDFICTVTDSAPSSVGVKITIRVDDIDVTAVAEKVSHDRKLAEQHAAAAQAQARALARNLAAHGVAVRDVGEALGVSFQRAQQLIST
ncbi:HicB family toxin-antitoxin system [Mycobacterium sp. pW045]|jgi:hypothetical protein|uniref:HicB family toxin-antitoxin system n=1 Tax=Mycobacterium sp. pW045 TaxID=3238984 RepID=UPI00351B5724